MNGDALRSEIVFRAEENTANRYQLCCLAAKVTRRLHFLSTKTSDAINDALVQLAMCDLGHCQLVGGSAEIGSQATELID